MKINKELRQVYKESGIEASRAHHAQNSGVVIAVCILCACGVLMFLLIIKFIEISIIVQR